MGRLGLVLRLRRLLTYSLTEKLQESSRPPMTAALLRVL
jgi:hypothetical protein